MRRIWDHLIVGVAASSVVALLGAVAEGGEMDKSSVSGGVLEFQVVSRGTNEPIAGVKLEIRISRETRDEVTDEQGRCRIEYGPQSPEYLSIRASKPGLVPMQVAWRAAPSPVEIPARYTLTMDPGTTIGGFIRDEQGQPIEGATVCLLVPSRGEIERVSIHDHREKTDAEGRWRCDFVPAVLDEIWIRLEHPDYISDEMFGTTPAPPLERLRDLTGVMVMKKGITVAGRVVDTEGRPIEGATVAQGSDRFGSHYPSARTDGEGRFEFKNARPQQMVLTVQARGYAPELEQIVPREGLAPVEFRLERGHILCGRIVDKQGNPVAGAFVAADTWRGHRSLSWRVDTDGDGRFRWDDAPADEVLMDMGKQHYMSIRHHGLTASDQEYTITMYPVLRVTGRVVDKETGQPIPQFMLCPGIDWGDGRAIYWERRQVKPFTDGAFEIVFSEPRYAHLIRIEAEGYLPGVSRPFEDGEGDVTYDLALAKGAGLSGTVHLPDGKPAAGAEVILCTSSQGAFIRNGRNEQRSYSIFVETDPDGRFSFPAQADAFRLVVLHDEGCAEVAGEELGDSSEVVLQAWGRVEGTVLIGRRPGVDEGVRLLFDRPFDRNAPRVQFDGAAVADKEGHFVLARVPPGKVRVCREIKVGDRATRFSHDVPVEVKAGETTRVTIGGTGRPIIGKIAIPDPVKEQLDWQTLDYYVRNQSREGPYRTLGVAFERDGTFRIDDVPAGDYCLYFSAYAPATVPRAFRGERIGSLTYPFAVAPMSGGRSDEPLDLGTLDLLTSGGPVAGPLLLGKAIPDLKELNLPVSSEELSGKRLLLCFFDLGQRPSRNAVGQLAGQGEALKAKGVVAIAVQASKTDEAAFKEWVQQNATSLPTGVLADGGNRSRSVWGVRSLPWLILTDTKHTVVAEGFAVGELDSKLARLAD